MIESLINLNTLEVDDRHNDPHRDYEAKKCDDLCPPRHEIHRSSRITQVGPVQTKVQKSHASKAGANKLYGEVSNITYCQDDPPETYLGCGVVWREPVFGKWTVCL